MMNISDAAKYTDKYFIFEKGKLRYVKRKRAFRASAYFKTQKQAEQHAKELAKKYGMPYVGVMEERTED